MAQLKKQKTARRSQVNLYFAVLGAVAAGTVQTISATAKHGGDLFRQLLQGAINQEAQKSGKSLEANQMTDDDFRKRCGALAQYFAATFRRLPMEKIPAKAKDKVFPGGYVQIDLGKNDTPVVKDGKILVAGEPIGTPDDATILAELPELPGVPKGERKAKSAIAPMELDLSALLAAAGVESEDEVETV